MPKIYEIYGTDAHEMTLALMQAADIAKIIPQGASIALKPNLVTGGKPERQARNRRNDPRGSFVGLY